MASERGRDDMEKTKTPPMLKNFLAGIVDLWGRDFIQQSMSVKRKFNEEAKTLVKFSGQDHDFVFGEGQKWVNMSGRPKATINKVDDAVSLFGPALFFSRPRREVSARRGDKDFAIVMEEVLNYLANHHDLERHSKRSVGEGIIKGANCLWSEIHPVTKMPYSRYYSISDVFADPDVTEFCDCKWMARRWAMPVWEVKRKWKQTSKGIQGAFDKISQRYDDSVAIDDDEDHQMGHVRDTEDKPSSMARYVWVYEFWSTIGLGQFTDSAEMNLKPEFKKSREAMRNLYGVDIKSHNLVITVSPNHPVPLDIKEWPVPFHKDTSRFPTEILFYKDRVDELWPKSILQSVIPLQRMIDWLASFMMQKSKDGSKDYIFVEESVQDKIEQAIAQARDNTLIPISLEGAQRQLQDVLFKLNGDGVNESLVGWFDKVMELFQESSGMTDVLQGFAGRNRETATSVQARVQSSNIRIDQMQKDVERWQALMAKKEAILAYSFLKPEQVDDIVGQSRDFGYYVEVSSFGAVMTNAEVDKAHPELSGYFDTEAEAMQMTQLTERKMQESGSGIGSFNFDVKKVTAAKIWEDQQAKGVDFIIDAFDFEIASGSARRPDRFEKITLAQSNLQLVGAAALQMGQVGVYNNLISNVYDAQDLPEEQRVFLDAPPPQGLMSPQEQMSQEGQMPPGGQMPQGVEGSQMPPDLAGVADQSLVPQDIDPLPVAIDGGQPVF